jgi:hypothetical protein
MLALLPCCVGCASEELHRQFLSYNVSEYAFRNRDVEGI